MLNNIMKTTYIYLLLVILFACKKQQAPPSIEYMKTKESGIYGIDVSKYQKRLDWSLIRKSDIRFAFIKATQGIKGRDPYFEKNWEGSKKNGVIRGAYHFFENTDKRTAILQAYNFISTVELEDGDLPPVLDIERKPFDKKHIESAKAWLWIVENFYQVKPIIYTGEYFYNKYLLGEFDDYVIWMAKYSENKPVLKDDKEYMFWQYTSDQRNIFSLENRSGRLDMNIFLGTESQLIDLTK